MRCPHCRTGLIEVPTLQFPQVDTCPKRHGVWLDAGELTLFINETAIQLSVMADTTVAVQTSCLCPRCATLLDEQMIGSEGGFRCAACRGVWLPEGALARLHERYGEGRTTSFDEPALYARAEKIQHGRQERVVSDPSYKRRSSADLLYWCLLGGLITLIFSVVTWESLRQVLQNGHWSGKVDEGFFFLLLGAGGGLAFFLKGFRLYRETRLIETTPTSAIRSLAVGLVEIIGQAEPAGPSLSAPFSGMPCVFYHYVVEERHRHGKKNEWITIAKGESPHPFLVRDATGAVTVLPIGAKLMLETRATYQNTGPMEFPPSAIAGLQMLGISTTGWLESKVLRCSEGFILPHETIYLLGTAQIGGQEQSQNGIGLVIGSSPNAPFLIADRNEGDLVHSMRRRLLALLVGGPALTAMCLWSLLKFYLAVAR